MRIVIPKDRFYLTEGVIRIITIDNDNLHKIFVKYPHGNIRLDDIAEEYKDTVKNLKEIIVLTEDYGKGRVIRYDTIQGCWYEMGLIYTGE